MKASIIIISLFSFVHFVNAQNFKDSTITDSILDLLPKEQYIICQSYYAPALLKDIEQELNFDSYSKLMSSNSIVDDYENCYSEQEFFLYSLKYALDYNDSTAINNLCAIIEKWKNRTKQRIDVYDVLIDFFRNENSSTIENNIHTYIKRNENIKEDYKSELKDYKYNFKHNNSPFIKDVLKCHSSSYHTLIDTLYSNCYNHDIYDYTIAAHVYASLIMTANDDIAYRANAYSIIKNRLDCFYYNHGIIMSPKMYLFSLYFLQQAADLGDSDAIIKLKEINDNLCQDK